MKDAKMKMSTQASCVDDNGTIWMFSNDCNALFSWKSGMFTYITSFDDENFFEGSLYNKALSYGDNIFFFPVRAKKIACYSRSRNQVTYVEIPERGKEEYFNVISGNKNQIWMFPVFKRKYAYVLNMEQKIIKKCTIQWNNMDLDENISLIGDAILDKYLYLAVSGTNFILKFNIENYECKKIEITEAIFRTHTCENFLCALNVSGNAVLQFQDGKLAATMFQTNRKIEDEHRGFTDMEYVDFFPVSSKGMLLLPMQSNGVYIDFKGGEKKIITGQSGCQLYDDVLRYQDMIYLMPYEGDEMVILNTNTFDITVVQLAINQEKYWKRMSQEVNKSGVLLDEGFVSLENFMITLR